MELEQRVAELEREVKLLKSDIEKTLVDIQVSLPGKSAATSRWQSKAWVLALINVLMALVLFTNIYLYLPGGAPFNLNPTLASWLHAFWLSLAFIWLILQLYPLALLFEEEDQQWQGVVWRNATAFLRARPSFLVFLTFTVLIVGIINSFIPATWLVATIALLIAVVSIAARNMIDLYRARSRARG
jgi:hypothetical protein